MCSLLSKEFNFVHLSAGELLRDAVKKNDENAEMLNRLMKEGIIVPPHITIGLLKKEIRYYLQNSNRTTFLVDGFPRNIEQGYMFEDEVKPCDFVLFLHAEDEQLLERLRSRADNEYRVDDNEESFRKRFRTYKETGYPAIENYGKMGKVKKVDMDSTVKENYKKLRQIFL
ncbi:adenylate kinase 1 [Anaeramoeba flamelloides]|uniref:Adenylate kinase 1 n=1 Tax=Anaeramoeba flamelloides TaxID=1746091 RepID=A0AAV8AAQ0_9EUKA|nr:adenylate kinase 1 isoform b [Anaeramoeba flamelloides]KAJ6234056.1 adenylate kinase 1 [Anaeramoeba flamelloides]